MIIDIVELLPAVVQCLEDMQQDGNAACNVQKCCQFTKQLEKFNSVAPKPWGPRGHVPPHFAIVRGHGGLDLQLHFRKNE